LARFADIASGKILKDDETVESYKIEEKGFVVCVVNKVLFLFPSPSPSHFSPTCCFLSYELSI